MHISIEESKSSVRFLATERNQKIGELDLFAEGPKTWVAHHTFVSPSHRGQGVAEQLFEALVGWASEHRHRIIPTCSYIIKRFNAPDAPRELLAGADART